MRTVQRISFAVLFILFVTSCCALIIALLLEKNTRRASMEEIRVEAELTYARWRVLTDPSTNCAAKISRLSTLNHLDATTLMQTLKMRCEATGKPLPPIWHKLKEINVDTHRQNSDSTLPKE